MSLRHQTVSGYELRQLARSNGFDDQTAGQAPDYLQGNVVILPRKDAPDFLRFCLNNPKPCPLIGVSRPGDSTLPGLGEDLDIRTDVPKYRVYLNGKLQDEVSDINTLWTEELVTFVLGCSFTFEQALMNEGFIVRHIDQGLNVPMFQTNIDTIPGGIFNGPLVVTMRSFKKQDIPAVFDICARYPHAHGAPLAWGDPKYIGIKDLQKPDYGDAVEVPDNEIPVFWACGVTPQAAIEKAKPDLCITHSPGCMLVTDALSSEVPTVDFSLSRFWNIREEADMLNDSLSDAHSA